MLCGLDGVGCCGGDGALLFAAAAAAAELCRVVDVRRRCLFMV